MGWRTLGFKRYAIPKKANAAIKRDAIPALSKTSKK